ncbi:uncharacterized protein LOC110683456 [Chenopodium quinoa]|uniref:uncharacterized protein LOC110683456 n=1 Tax=Chenopodium quinoa TaxID=63459 RepID=UPI000B77CB69|nr:uncharacterized protein LOC110683456 [Chenopodium quinoa]
MAVSDKKFNEIMTHNKMLETQITQLSNTLKDCASPSSLPSQGIDPKKPVYSITTRRGRVLEEKVSKDCEDKEKSVSREKKEEDVSKDVSKEESHEKKKSVERKQEEVRKPDLSYPQKFMRNKLDEKFGRFLDMLKEVHLFIPLTEAMTQMPRYSKFLKDILSGKRYCNEIDSVELGECYSALIHNDLPKKMKDPGRPFLATSGSLIDVKGGRITLSVGNKKESFELKPMQESLSLLKGFKSDDSLRSFDNVYVIDSSSKNVHDIFDNVLVSFDCMKVSEDKKCFGVF